LVPYFLMKHLNLPFALCLSLGSTLVAEDFDAVSLNHLGNVRSSSSQPKFGATLASMRRQVNSDKARMSELEHPSASQQAAGMNGLSLSSHPSQLPSGPQLSAEEEAKAVDLYRKTTGRQEAFRPSGSLAMRKDQLDQESKTPVEPQESPTGPLWGQYPEDNEQEIAAEKAKADQQKQKQVQEAEVKAKMKAELEAKAKAHQEAKAKSEAEKEAQMKAKTEAEAQAKAEKTAAAEAKKIAAALAKAEREAKNKAQKEAEAKAKAEKTAAAKAQQEAKRKADLEAQAKEEVEARAQAQKIAEAKAKEEVEARAQQEAETNKEATKKDAWTKLKDIQEAEAKMKADEKMLAQKNEEAAQQPIPLRRDEKAASKTVPFNDVLQLDKTPEPTPTADKAAEAQPEALKKAPVIWSLKENKKSAPKASSRRSKETTRAVSSPIRGLVL
jgi:hypothetical protein